MNFNKKYVIVFLITIFLLAIINRLVDFQPYKALIRLKDSFILYYATHLHDITQRFDLFLAKKEEIDDLLKERKKNEELTLLATSTLNELNELLRSYKITLNHPGIKRVRVISLANLMDSNRLWIDMPMSDSDKIYGLVYNNYAMGIAIAKDGRALAILNADQDSAYSVHIGKKRVLGMVGGYVNKQSDDIWIQFISIWANIKVGDEVVTSGLDNIFFKGIKVGRIKSIEIEQGFKKAIIEPYFKSHDIGLFLYVIDM